MHKILKYNPHFACLFGVHKEKPYQEPVQSKQKTAGVFWNKDIKGQNVNQGSPVVILIGILTIPLGLCYFLLCCCMKWAVNTAIAMSLAIFDYRSTEIQTSVLFSWNS